MDQVSRPLYEFAGFRLDPAGQRLIGPDGSPIALPSRAFDALRYLVERAGELVEKAELMRAIWPRTVVEENNLSQCIVAIRRALGEDAAARKFVLTVPGRGFKFVEPVRVASGDVAVTRAGAALNTASQPPERRPPRPRRRPWLAAGALFATALAAGIGVRGLWIRSAPVAPAVTSPAEYVPLTDVADSAAQPALSPDGRLLAFMRGDASFFMNSGQIWLKSLPTGESLQLTHETGWIFAPAFAPDGTHIAYTVVDKARPAAPWVTRMIALTGGESSLLLPNASGLQFIGPHELLYSEFKSGVHLGLVTSLENRSRHRDVYLPEHERGMAHFSWLSPDRKSVLVVEMGGNGQFQRCRLVPFDGGSSGRPVGPEGICLSAAWSPDGAWMYFAAVVAGHAHLWRQRFPDGEAEQITFGPTEETQVAVYPDGRALLGTVGQRRSTIWIHDGQREHSLDTEGYAHAPRLSGDGRRIYYLSERAPIGGAELLRMNVATGQYESLLPGVAIRQYDLSADEQRIVYTIDAQGTSEIWVARLDRGAPPARLIRGGDQVAFDASGRVHYRSLGAQANHLHRMNADGSGDVELLGYPIADFQAVAPDGQWVVVGLPLEHDVAHDIGAEFLAPVAGGPPRLLTRGWSAVRWSRDGRRLYVDSDGGEGPPERAHTAVLRLRADELPAAAALAHPERSPAIPHALESLALGPDPASYVYLKTDDWQNIYRIPLH